ARSAASVRGSGRPSAACRPALLGTRAMSDASAIAHDVYAVLLTPEEVTSRVIERINVSPGVLRRRTSIEFSRSLVAGTLVPVLRMRRGHLLNNFTIEEPAEG